MKELATSFGDQTQYELTYYVPKESIIKKELNAFFLGTSYHPRFKLIPYDGLKSEKLNDGQENRHTNYLRIKELFSSAGNNVPDMKNGHAKMNSALPSSCTIDRCLMLATSSNKVIGAIFFRINLALRRCLVANIAIDPEYQENKLGSLLWHAAVVISILYGCKMITGCSVNTHAEEKRLQRFYEHCGCQFFTTKKPNVEVDKMSILDLTDAKSKKTFLSNISNLSPNYAITPWLEQLLGNNQLAPSELNTKSIANADKLFFNDLLGFLQETDPKYANSMDTINQSSRLILDGFSLALSCDKKPLHYSVEKTKLPIFKKKWMAS